LSVILVGVDRFEEYLHRRGRTDANAVLKAIARLLTASLRNKVDIACVHADGEFGLLLPNTPPFKPGAALVGQRLRRAVEGMEFRDEDHASLGRFTVSIGVAGYPRHADDAEELGGLAVGALAEARTLGGNRVHVHGAPPAAYGPESEDDEEPAARGGEADGDPEDPIAALIRAPDWDDHIDDDDLPLTADHTGLGNERADRRRQANLDAPPDGTEPGTQRPPGVKRREAAVKWREDEAT
ncbi:MAG TPA: GGDEF domain-containing protein, partial [Thermoleophilia bacterium]|nr:GGDEF domain-containing protein [Thermoleophilia bacterium]